MDGKLVGPSKDGHTEGKSWTGDALRQGGNVRARVLKEYLFCVKSLRIREVNAKLVRDVGCDAR